MVAIIADVNVRVRLFGHLAAQASEISVTVETATAGAVLDAVARRDPSLKLRGVKVAVNDDYATPGTPVKNGDVVSLLPPVGGG